MSCGINGSHDLILSKPAGSFGSLHGISVADVGVLDVREAEGATTILIAGELGCEIVSNCQPPKPTVPRSLQIAVSALSAVSNSTTPVPRERPLGSYCISARSTLPIVVNSSTRSSLLVDHGSYCSQRQ